MKIILKFLSTLISVLLSIECSAADEAEGARNLVESCISRDSEMFKDSLTQKIKEIRIASSGSWKNAMNDYCPEEMVKEFFHVNELTDIEVSQISYETSKSSSQTLVDIYYKGNKTQIGGSVRYEDGWKWDSN